MDEDESHRRATVIMLASLVFFVVSIYMIFFWVPLPKTGFTIPEAQPIFYFHLSLAITTYISFTVVFISSILLLHSAHLKWDRLCGASAEVGVVFATLTLFSGSLWGKAEWDAYWRWGDLKLVTFLVLWLIFAAYLTLRGSIEQADRMPRLAGVFAIVGYICVPFSYFSMYIWQTIHPIVISPGGGGLKTEMMVTLVVTSIGFMLLLTALIHLRVKQLLLEGEIHSLLNESKEVVDNG